MRSVRARVGERVKARMVRCCSEDARCSAVQQSSFCAFTSVPRSIKSRAMLSRLALDPSSSFATF
jgi:hypothetical protein